MGSSQSNNFGNFGISKFGNVSNDINDTNDTNNTMSPITSTNVPDITPAPWVDPNLPRITTITTFLPIVTNTTNKTGFQCTTNEDCMNLDSYRSKPGRPPVYSCPSATCVSGTCSCEPDCKFDSYSGVCCQGLETINGESYCVEDTSQPLDSGESQTNFYNSDPIFWFVDMKKN